VVCDDDGENGTTYTASMRSSGKPVSDKYRNPTLSNAERRSARNSAFVAGSRALESGRTGTALKGEDGPSTGEATMMSEACGL
jgi:hypothetical protein